MLPVVVKKSAASKAGVVNEKRLKVRGSVTVLLVVLYNKPACTRAGGR